MAQYEIRFIRPHGGPLVLLSEHASDFEAVRGARIMVQPGDGLEIWGDDGCVYSSPAATAPLPPLVP